MRGARFMKEAVNLSKLPDSPAGTDAVARIEAALAARSRFDAAAHLRLMVGASQVGWLPRAHAEILLAQPTVPAALEARGAHEVALLPRCTDFAARSAALAELARWLAGAGHVRGWRDELFAVTPALQAPALAVVERAAARFFGLLTFASHMNGIVGDGDGRRRFWIARRSPAKAVDPGMWDNLVAGGMPHGSDPLATLVRECEEESGIPPDLAAQAQACGVIEVLRELPEGVQWEAVHAYDLLLPAGFIPVNRDGEVAEHRLIEPGPLLAIMADGAMTVDATLVTLDALRRRGWAASGTSRA